MKTVLIEGRRYNINKLFHCDISVETYCSFWEIYVLFNRFGLAAPHIEGSVCHNSWLTNEVLIKVPKAPLLLKHTFVFTYFMQSNLITHVPFVRFCPVLVSYMSFSVNHKPSPITKAPSTCPTSISGFMLKKAKKSMKSKKKITLLVKNQVLYHYNIFKSL